MYERSYVQYPNDRTYTRGVASDGVDGRRVRGDSSRRAILERATDIASVEGLDGLTIGRLATETGRSKSSISTLFGTKEGLQLATVAAASHILVEAVIAPALDFPKGLRRLAAALRNDLDYSRRRVFTGGCFFVATSADVDSKPGPVRDAVRGGLQGWYDYVEEQLSSALNAGEVAGDGTDMEEIAFILISLANEANSRSLLIGSDRPYDLAASAMRERLITAGADPEFLTALTAPHWSNAAGSS
jgi:AcrR family transcriptional regulator